MGFKFFFFLKIVFPKEINSYRINPHHYIFVSSSPIYSRRRSLRETPLLLLFFYFSFLSLTKNDFEYILYNIIVIIHRHDDDDDDIIYYSLVIYA